MPTQSAPLVIRLRPSRIGRAVMLVVTSTALASIALTDLPPVAVVAAVVCTFVLTLHAWRTRIPLELRLFPDGSLEIRHPAQAWQTAQVLTRSTVNPWLTVLAYRLEGEHHSRSITLLPDSLSRDDFRRLRVWLGWRADTIGPAK